MHARSVSITASAVISCLSIFWSPNATAQVWFDGQEILVECPVWEWEASPIPGIEYELCFDDVDHCTVAEIGDSVCIPSLGVHDVWVTAIDRRYAEPIYYEGDIVAIERLESSDFTADGLVGFADFNRFAAAYGTQDGVGDLDRDGLVGFRDYYQFSRSFGKCVNATGTVYMHC